MTLDELIVEWLFFQKRQEQQQKAGTVSSPSWNYALDPVRLRIAALGTDVFVIRQGLVGIEKLVASDPYLLDVVGALHATRRLTCRLHCRKQQRYEHADDRNHDQ